MRKGRHWLDKLLYLFYNECIDIPAEVLPLVPLAWSGGRAWGRGSLLNFSLVKSSVPRPGFLHALPSPDPGEARPAGRRAAQARFWKDRALPPFPRRKGSEWQDSYPYKPDRRTLRTAGGRLPHQHIPHVKRTPAGRPFLMPQLHTSISFHPAGYASGAQTLPSIRLSYAFPL